MNGVSRRNILKTLILTASSALWLACRRMSRSDAPRVPTLAEVEHIRATQIAASTKPGLPPTKVDTPPTATQPAGETAGSQPTDTPTLDWPPVERDQNGFLVTKPIERFYEVRYRNAGPRPEIAIRDWSLTIEGWVDKPQSLTYETLTTLPQVEELRTLECISNPVGGPLIGTTVWRGVRMADLLDLVGVRSGAREVKMTAADGYQTSIPVDLAADPRSLLAFQMGGEPLPIQHGYPLRVLLPGRYGQKQPKWITHLEVITGEFLGYWEQQGWSNEARVRVNSQIWEPSALSVIAGKSSSLWGIAYANTSGVSLVEVSTDGGTSWQEASLMPGPSSLVWTEWRFDWQLPQPSELRPFTLAVRATDGDGNTQRAAQSGGSVLNSAFPNGASDIHRIVVRVEPLS